MIISTITDVYICLGFSIPRVILSFGDVSPLPPRTNVA